MKRLRWNLVVFVVAIVLLVGFVAGWSQSFESEGTRLPGSRPTIDAAKFPSLQAAFDAVPAEGGMVLIPAGEFEINQPIVITRSDILVKGTGTATHIINLNTEGKPALVLQHPSGKDDREAELWRIKIADIRITGNDKSGHGIEALRINELFIDGVTVSHHGGDGIRLYYCYEDPRICDSLMTYNKGTGLNLIGCHDIVVAANQFEENQDAVRCVDGFNLCMTGNNLDDHLGNGVVIRNTYGSVVAGNMIEECQGTAIVLDDDSYGVALSANVIAHNVAGGIDLRDAHGSAVSANAFTILKKDALRIGPESGRIAVSGNSFSDSYIGRGKIKREADDREAAGLILNSTSDVAVVGNLFSSLRPKGLAVEGVASRRVLFSSNVLTDAPSDQSKLEESLVSGNLSSLVE